MFVSRKSKLSSENDDISKEAKLGKNIEHALFLLMYLFLLLLLFLFFKRILLLLSTPILLLYCYENCCLFVFLQTCACSFISLFDFLQRKKRTPINGYRGKLFKPPKMRGFAVLIVFLEKKISQWKIRFETSINRKDRFYSFSSLDGNRFRSSSIIIIIGASTDDCQ